MGHHQQAHGKASVGMYSGRNYPHKSYLCAFCPCHHYRLHPSILLFFILVVLLTDKSTCYSTLIHWELVMAFKSDQCQD